MSLLRTLAELLVLLVISITSATGQKAAKVSFVNFLTTQVELFWHDPNGGEPVDMGTLEPFGQATHATFEGHRFSYKYSWGTSKDYLVEGDDIHGIFIPRAAFVECRTTKGPLMITVMPKWSPLGAGRFLELVHNKYFDGCALNRVVKGFLTQFGIGADHQQRTLYRKDTIYDDPPVDIKFKPGYMAYAGSGPNSRTTEVFIVMPDTPQHQLDAFGNNPWETPFAYVDEENVENTVANWYAYGDMPPWGSGPDPQEIYKRNGYDVYLKNEFPKMDYIENCIVFDVEGDEVVDLLDEL